MVLKPLTDLVRQAGGTIVLVLYIFPSKVAFPRKVVHSALLLYWEKNKAPGERPPGDRNHP